MHRSLPRKRAVYAALWVLGLVLGSLLSACYREIQCQGPYNAPPREAQCAAVGGPAEAIATGILAGGLWAAGGGCKIAGCHPTLVCNEKSGFCERARCDEGQTCPPGTRCSSRTLRCH